MTETVENNGISVEVEDHFDRDGELSILIEDGFNNIVSVYLSRREVVRLKNHLTSVLESK